MMDDDDDVVMKRREVCEERKKNSFCLFFFKKKEGGGRFHEANRRQARLGAAELANALVARLHLVDVADRRGRLGGVELRLDLHSARAVLRALASAALAQGARAHLLSGCA